MNNLKSFSRHFQDQVHLKIEYFDHIQIRTHTAGSPCNLLYIYIYKKNTTYRKKHYNKDKSRTTKIFGFHDGNFVWHKKKKTAILPLLF